MNSPLSLICNHYFIPQEIENIIQSYTINDFAYKVLQEYFHYLYAEQDLYDDFVYHTYIAPLCYCHKLRRNKDCNHCYYYEYTTRYKLNSYINCIWDNNQYSKIVSRKNNFH